MALGCCLALAPSAAMAASTVYAVGGVFPGSLNRVEAYDVAAGSWTARAPMLTPRQSPGLAVAANGKLYAVGGRNGSSYLNSVEEYDPVANTWTARAPMLTPREAPGLALAANGKLYAVGGFNGSSLLNSVEEYDPTTDTWTAKASMSSARYLPGLAAAANGKLYAVGGYNGSSNLNSLEEYDPTTDAWAFKAPMPTARAGLGLAASANGRLYAVGGHAPGVGVLATTEEYDPIANTWTAKAAMPTARSGLGLAAADNGRLYAVGGNNNTSAIFLATTEEYNPANNMWTAKPNMPGGARSWPGVAATPPTVTPTGPNVLAVGGRRGSNVLAVLATAEAYLPATNSWISRAPMATAREAPGLALAANGKLYAVGGRDGSGDLKSVEEYDPATNKWTPKAPMSFPRYALGLVAAANGKLYAVGGYHRSLEEYDPATDTWTRKAPMSTDRQYLGFAAAANGKLYAVGGTDGSLSYLNSVEEYDPTTDTWTPKAPMSTAREGLGLVAAANGKLYAVGGRDGIGNFLESVEEYDPVADTWTTKASIFSSPRSALGLAAADNGRLYAVGGIFGGEWKTFEYNPASDVWTAKADMPGGGRRLLAAAAMPAFPLADLAVTVTDSPDPVTAGQNLAYTITVSNNGPNAAQTASWSDTLPAGTTFVSLPTVAGWTCTTPTVGAGGTVTCNNPSFAVSSAVFTLTVAVAPSLAGGTVLSNTVTATAATADANSGNNSATATTTVTTSADVSVTKTGPASAQRGQTISYSLTAGNAGPSTASSVSLSDTLPSGLTFASFTQTSGPTFTCTTGATVNCSIANFAAGASAAFTLVANVEYTAPLSVSNTATISSATSDSNGGNNSSSFTANVTAALTSTTVTSSANPSRFGQSVTFTATVIAGATATGTVTFMDGATSLGTVPLSGGQATLTTSSLAMGGHSITATYSGDGNFTGSTGTLAGGQTVQKADTATSVAAAPNPSVFGQSVTLTATVAATAPGVGTRTGTVTFKEGTTTLGTGSVNASGQASVSTAALSTSSHQITAEYGGDSNFNASTTAVAATQTVNKAATTTAVATSKSPSVFGESVTFTATVSPTAPGAGPRTGTVTFVDTTTGITLGSSAVNAGGVATLATTALSVATHTITASYSGDGNFNTSSGSLAQSVNKGATTTTVTSSANPSTPGQTVTLTATVAVTAPAQATPSGTVEFKDGATVLGSGALTGGKASFAAANLSAGQHAITAVYSGDNNLLGSTSAVLTQIVDLACADLFADATTLSGGNGAIAGSSGAATGESGEPDHAGASAALNSVWCKWSAPANGAVSFDTTGSLFDTTLAAYTGATVASLTPVAANDNLSSANTRSRIRFTAVQGATYYIAIDGVGAASGRYLLNWAQDAANASTYAAVLPYARSTVTGTPSTALATMLNAGPTTASQCSIAMPPGFPGTFSYQTTDANNNLSGAPNTPVNIPPGSGRTFMFAIAPVVDLVEAEFAPIFACANTPVTVSAPGANTFLLSASASPTPDLAAVSVTPSQDGIVAIPGNTGTGFFVAAAINVGSLGTITATADDNGRALPLALTICETNPTTGACINPPAPTVSTTAAVPHNGTIYYTVFVQGSGAIAFDPANNRLFLRLRSADGVTRGATNVAVRTGPAPSAELPQGLRNVSFN
jgi:uncharacterized repeat protein (TIGR01451 family)